MAPESTEQAVLEQNPFHGLLAAIQNILGPSSGLDSENVDPSQIQDLMRAYKSDIVDWCQYALLDPSKQYTRNLVDHGNGNSNLVSRESRFAAVSVEARLTWVRSFWSGGQGVALQYMTMRTHTV